MLSLIGIESGLAGFGLETLADVAKGGAWYIGLLATPGAADTFFRGRERTLIGDFILPSATAVSGAASAKDVAEFARGYARDSGWSGALALYGSMLREGDAFRTIARNSATRLPTLAIDRAGSDFTFQNLSAIHAGTICAITIDSVGHYIAQEAPERLAPVLLNFMGEDPVAVGH